MKILAIRGKNLASLAEEFEIDLERAPLQGCGLFAISGPTGAGKSTLLDAMCLALFDRIPRLSGRGGPEVGRPDDDPALRLAAYDVRQVLRRGAGRGHAEVDFRGSDGRCYRARWTAWRARDRANGAFQNQSIDLIDVETGQRLGGKKTETLKVIEQKLGLTFDQFCRSALLAQGEFAAFLRADESERADLLERITGTEIYSELSKAAHARSRLESEVLAKLETEANAIPVLEEAARAEVEASLQASLSAEVETQRALKTASSQVAWYAQRARLSEEVAHAEAELQRTHAAVEASGSKREELERVLQAQTLRHELEAVDAARTAHSNAAAQQTADAAALEEATRLHDAAVAARAEREGARNAAVEREENARAEIEAAEALDARFTALDGVANKASAQATQAEQKLREAQQEVKALRAQQVQVSAARDEAQAWLVAHGGIEALALEWPRWKTALERYVTAWTEGHRLEPKRRTLLDESERATQAVRKAHSAQQEAVASLVLAQAACEDAHSKRDAAPVDPIRSEREAVAEKRARLGRLAELAAQLQHAREAAEKNRRSAEEAGTAAAGHGAEREAAQTELLRVEVRLDEARRALENARTAQSQRSLRAQLREGEPCPLCGSKEHPLRGESEIDALVATATKRSEELEAERKRWQQVESSAAAEEKAARARAAECARSADEYEKTATALRLRWDAEGDDFSGLPQTAAELGTAADGLKAQEDALRAEEKRRAALADAAVLAQRNLEKARATSDSAREALRAAEKAAQELEKRQAELDGQYARFSEARDAAEAELQAPLAAREGWREVLKQDPAALLRACAEDTSAFTARNSALQSEQKTLDALAAKLVSANALVDERSTEAQRAKAAADEELARRNRCAEERAKLLGGQPTAAFKLAVRSARESAERALTEAVSKATEAEKHLIVSRARCDESMRRIGELSEQLERAVAALSQALERIGLSEAELRSLLSRNQPWNDATRGELARLDEALTRCRTVLEERQSRRASHDSTERPAISEEDARAAEANAQTALQTAQAAVAEAKALLKQDDEARARRGERQALIDSQRQKADVWRKLDAVIGSASGNTFKVFAQSLTLDALLQPANHHLSELAPRYRLMRVPGNDLALQIVDGDMGEEVRSVSSLSGGESFLVSLALALGLASLSSTRTQVETLFIDEGFGTLDPEALDSALNTLEALQAAGRQVGIISHVSGLAERIGVQVRVEKLGGGRSRIRVHGPEFAAEPPSPVTRVG